MTRTLFLGAALLAAPAALAQQHGDMDHSQMDHSQMDHSQMQGMDHGSMDHDALMALHMRMMADPEIHAAMQADPEMRALMAGAMSATDHGGMDHTTPMNADARAAAMDRMRERMAALSPDEHAAFMAQMEASHRRLLASPAVHMRAMADPELRRMMEDMPGGMPGMGGADQGSMDHDGMDHGSMEGMNHDQMPGTGHAGADHAAGVAMQRRNAGALRNDDERPATPTVGPEAFDASATADRFHAALAAGDREAVRVLLLPDAVVLGGGQAEARNEYLGGRFARDAALLAGAPPEPLFRRTTVATESAWVASAQQVGDARIAELLVMKQTPEGWRISAVHWSSAR
ncbi:nuclear transport factor 2 family protein [Rubrivirga litoralis]|uniref:Nuclear transport factor 2 family protein n=1 Tax=Rubrivirga litoralis TaxID=3075598 RepID=A0ABU3BNB2_9BACT|nr:nuclear transport factor 2 family protein [Rubrivirga sp. F394]MDT0630760.1 nuclear transport factor 2 family protein [Rubrivirga sp. F394]